MTMTRTLLRIDSSPRADDRSRTRRLTAQFEQVWRTHNPAGRVVHRDLRLELPPHVDQAWIEAAFVAAERRTPSMRKALSTSGDTGYEPGGPIWHMNHLEPHLQTIFEFVGVADVRFIYSGNDEFGGVRLRRSMEAAVPRVQEAVSKDHLIALGAQLGESFAPSVGAI